jgi:isopenicillin N synthase-like dioxygenase
VCILVFYTSLSKMVVAADIAVVSFERFINGDDSEQRAVAKELYEAFSTVGWVYLKDHGIPQERVDEIFALVSSSRTSNHS